MVCVIPPPTAVLVTVVVPTAADALAVKVSVDVPDPGAAIGLGTNAAVTPLGSADVESVIPALKPPEIVVVMVEVPLFPCATVTELGAAETVKSGFAVDANTTSTQ